MLRLRRMQRRFPAWTIDGAETQQVPANKSKLPSPKYTRQSFLMCTLEISLYCTILGAQPAIDLHLRFHKHTVCCLETIIRLQTDAIARYAALLGGVRVCLCVVFCVIRVSLPPQRCALSATRGVVRWQVTDTRGGSITSYDLLCTALKK